MKLIEQQLRLKKLIQSIDSKGIVIVPSDNGASANHDSRTRFSPYADFYYLSGLTESNSILIVLPGRAEGETILFLQTSTKEQEKWTGKRVSLEEACQFYGADQAFHIDEFTTLLPQLLLGRETIYYPFGYNCKLEKNIRQAIASLERQIRSGVGAPERYIGLSSILHEMRIFKSKAEIDIMRKAAQISAAAHKRAMSTCKPGMMEYMIEAELMHEFYKQGSFRTAYPNIVAGGANACTLHYDKNNALLRDGDLLLIDAGCEYENYASDITRTFPVNGCFTKEQQAIYEIVLAAQLEAIEQVRAGKYWHDNQKMAWRIITQGLIDLGILKGSLNDLLEEKAYLQFYPHNISHWLGMDVHDVGKYKIDNQWRQLSENMVCTVEPGIYIDAGSPNVAEKWWNIGIRIEDDVLITASGYEVLSKDAPKTIADIEALMAGKNC